MFLPPVSYGMVCYTRITPTSASPYSNLHLQEWIWVHVTANFLCHPLFMYVLKCSTYLKINNLHLQEWIWVHIAACPLICHYFKCILKCSLLKYPTMLRVCTLHYSTWLHPLLTLCRMWEYIPWGCDIECLYYTLISHYLRLAPFTNLYIKLCSHC